MIFKTRSFSHKSVYHMGKHKNAPTYLLCLLIVTVQHYHYAYMLDIILWNEKKVQKKNKTLKKSPKPQNCKMLQVRFDWACSWTVVGKCKPSSLSASIEIDEPLHIRAVWPCRLYTVGRLNSSVPLDIH